MTEIENMTKLCFQNFKYPLSTPILRILNFFFWIFIFNLCGKLWRLRIMEIKNINFKFSAKENPKLISIHLITLSCYLKRENERTVCARVFVCMRANELRKYTEICFRAQNEHKTSTKRKIALPMPTLQVKESRFTLMFVHIWFTPLNSKAWYNGISLCNSCNLSLYEGIFRFHGNDDVSIAFLANTAPWRVLKIIRIATLYVFCANWQTYGASVSNTMTWTV